MQDFKLFLLPSPGDTTLQVRAFCPSVGESELELVSQDRLQRLIFDSQYLYGAGDAADVERVGDEVFETFFIGSVRDRFIEAYRDGSLRLLIAFPGQGSEHLQTIAWETCRYKGRYLARATATPLVRYLEQGEPVRRVAIDERPVRVLLTTSNPRSDYLPNLSKEVAAVIGALMDVNKEKHFDCKLHPGITLAQLKVSYLKAKRKRPFHIWHHCGHGRLRGESFELLFENGSSKLRWVDTEKLHQFIQDGDALKLALLNVCHSGSPQGMSSRLARLNIPLTIGYSTTVADEAAVRFIRTFYGALGAVSVDVAVNQAREELVCDPDPIEWTKVVLYSRNLAAEPLLAGEPKSILEPEAAPPRETAPPSPTAKSYDLHIGVVKGGATIESNPDSAKTRIDEIGKDLNLISKGRSDRG